MEGTLQSSWTLHCHWPGRHFRSCWPVVRPVDAEGPAMKLKTPRIVALLFLLTAYTVLGHIGSPDVYYEGNAGPYPIRVVVRPPGVVPGLAEINVRLLDGHGDRVTVLPVYFRSGRKGAPPPDVAERVRGDTNLFTASLWFMESGAYSIDIAVEGAAGK